MVSWWNRKRAGQLAAAWLASRNPRSGTVERLQLDDVSPELDVYLGQAAYLQLSLYETMGRAGAGAPTLSGRLVTGVLATTALERHRAIVAEIERGGKEPADLMAPHRDAIDRFLERTSGADWYESMLTGYVTAGILNDLFANLLRSLPIDVRQRLRTVFDTREEPAVVEELTARIDEDPVVASRLAMWGRRLVGDTLLVARSALASHAREDQERLEPVWTELIAAHTRRMDALGLTA
ncbi:MULTISPECIES: ferritin-like domain-containing protein [unclassified Curtobacterium]|uniref:ferritin-like domain-containing protein n=1 Tax=unclassified Curtobacterium TaxID=257496 RepID=UPI0021ABA2E7|nr:MULTISPECIES: ferritin-like domain-containing protein [unclassified Curtobacterium]WIB12051.1 ferritin-like domain-containing protein [Curtobacterium sp. MCPF17_052]